MYCPNCSAPIDGVKFCRSCGANVSLVPQALTGELPTDQRDDEKRSKRRRHQSDKPASIERAANKFFSGIGFIFVAFAIRAFFPAGHIWWFWMLIPAFALIGDGVGLYLKYRQQNRLPEPPSSDYIASRPSPVHLPESRPGAISSHQAPASGDAPTTSQLSPPSSITEHTTKHLDKMKR